MDPGRFVHRLANMALPDPQVFGPEWDATNTPSGWSSTETPVGETCEGCGGLVTYSARGVIAPEPDDQGLRMARYHLRCFRQSGHHASSEV